MGATPKSLAKFLPYLLGGILFFAAAIRFFSLGDIAGMLITCAAGLTALLLGWQKS